MMNHKQKDRDPDNFGKLAAGVAFIVFLTTAVILGTDGIAAIWNMIF